jgi:undecaprenyl-diphosphatase
MPERIWKRLLKLLRGFRAEPLIPAVLLLMAGAMWGFMEIADEVGEGESRDLDQRILLAMREPQDTSDPIGPQWLEETGRDLTALGGFTLLTGLSLAAVGTALLLRRPRVAATIVVAIAGGTLLSTMLKRGYDRPRPDLVSHDAVVSTASFPSGHSMMSAIVYLTLGTLLARAMPTRGLKVYVVALAVMLTLLVGASRVYLGVHWPTDVVAGWAVGAAWALLFWLISAWLSVGDGNAAAKE